MARCAVEERDVHVDASEAAGAEQAPKPSADDQHPGAPGPLSTC
jgi:hypothetical protein